MNTTPLSPPAEAEGKRSRKAVLPILTILFFIAGCSGGSSVIPEGPDHQDELSLTYCRVVEVDNQMHVQWEANHKTHGIVRYGRNTLTESVTLPSLADSHDVMLFPLAYNADYVYRLTASDSAGNSVDCNGEFTTPDKATPWPVLTNLTITGVTESSAQISWLTDEPATTVLKFGHGTLADSITADSFSMTHTVILTGLSPITMYLLRAEAVDTTGLRGTGRDSSFQTAAQLMVWFPDAQIQLGDTVQVPVYVGESSDLAALQYRIQLSHNVEIIDLTEGPFYTERQGFAFFRAVQSSLGQLTNHMTWSIEYQDSTQSGTMADGDGIVAYMKLRGIEPGAVTAAFSPDSTFGLDMFQHMRRCSLRVGNLTVGQ